MIKIVEPNTEISTMAAALNEQVTATELVDRLASHKTLAGIPREELAWLVAHGRVRHLAVGDVLSLKSVPVENLFVILSGQTAIYVDRGGGRKKVMEWRGGDITGLMPYSRMKYPPGDSFAEEPSEALVIHSTDFPELVTQCPSLTARLVHVMLDRARVFNASELHDEKMVSLGKLAAGLAHELNNPASAASRSATLLAAGLDEADEASRALVAAALNPQQLAAIEEVRTICLRAHDAPSSPLERADREEAIASWLEDHKADAALAGSLADTAVTLESLDKLTEVMDGPALDAALHWIAAGCGTRALAMEIERAASRIYTLVSAVKGFTYMDRATVPEPIEIGRGLSDTIAVLGAKASSKSVSVTVELDKDLPPVRGFGGELNQVWANLLDNALDAVPEGGHVSVTASRERGNLVVRIVDDGAGIPPEIIGRVFDPFFTTKPVGEGTGLGLDIVRRLVRRHDGQIEAESRPGHTEFRVTLPALD